MKRVSTWKVVILGAALTGLSVAGAGAASAQTDALRGSAAAIGANLDAPLGAGPNCSYVGGSTTHCQTNGSSQIVTAPNPRVGNPWGIYGPFFYQNRGLGGPHGR